MTIISYSKYFILVKTVEMVVKASWPAAGTFSLFWATCLLWGSSGFRWLRLSLGLTSFWMDPRVWQTCSLPPEWDHISMQLFRKMLLSKVKLLAEQSITPQVVWRFFLLAVHTGNTLLKSKTPRCSKMYKTSKGQFMFFAHVHDSQRHLPSSFTLQNNYKSNAAECKTAFSEPTLMYEKNSLWPIQFSLYTTVTCFA